MCVRRQGLSCTCSCSCMRSYVCTCEVTTYVWGLATMCCSIGSCITWHTHTHDIHGTPMNTTHPRRCTVRSSAKLDRDIHMHVEAYTCMSWSCTSIYFEIYMHIYDICIHIYIYIYVYIYL